MDLDIQGIKVTKGLFRETISLPGKILPVNIVYLGAIEGGRVEKVFVDAGSTVKKGSQILELAKKRQQNLTLVAPVSGQLTSLNAEVGETKSPGERLGQIDQWDGFKVRANIEEKLIAQGTSHPEITADPTTPRASSGFRPWRRRF